MSAESGRRGEPRPATRDAATPDALATGIDPEAAFEQLRARLFGVAYRMTGSVADADDCCQEAWMRWRRADHASVRNPEAWLVRTTTRLAIDRLRSAQHRRESYVGSWVPEPLVEPIGAQGRSRADEDPAERAELADSLTFAFLVVLDELSPTERAVLLLHDVFGYEFEEVAAAVGCSPAACRQAASRVRRRLAARDPSRPPPDPEPDERRVLDDLLTSMATGDTTAVLALLAPDVVHLSDGGAHRRAARRPVVGAERVARLLVNLAKRTPEGATIELVQVNRAPGVLVRVDGRPDLVMTLHVDADGRIDRVWAQLNPDKLAHVQ